MKRVDWGWAHRTIVWLFVIMVLTGCQAWPFSRSQPDVSLTMTGNVVTGGAWDAERLQRLGLMELVAIHPSGEEIIWQGVLLKDLLQAAEPGPGTSRLIFTDSKGDGVEMPLDVALACQDCLVAFDPRGRGFNLAMPGLPAELWVRNLVRIELQ